MNNKIILTVLLVLLFALSCFSASWWGYGYEATNHCWRQDVNRINSASIASLTINSDYSVNPSSASGIPTIIVSPYTILNIKNIQQYTLSCDDGAGTSRRNFVALWNDDANRIVATNTPPLANGNPSGPATTGVVMCVNSDGNICYKIGAQFVFADDSCGKMRDNVTRNFLDVGIGTIDNFNYALDGNFAPKRFSLRLATLSPGSQNPLDPRITYAKIPNATWIIQAGYPSLLVFGPEKARLIGSFNDIGQQGVEMFFTLVNKTPFTETLNDYFIDCQGASSCNVELNGSGQKIYKGFKLFPNTEMIIKATGYVNLAEIPKAFTAKLDVNFSSDDFRACNFDVDAPGQPIPEQSSTCTVNDRNENDCFSCEDNEFFDVGQYRYCFNHNHNKSITTRESEDTYCRSINSSSFTGMDNLGLANFNVNIADKQQRLANINKVKQNYLSTRVPYQNAYNNIFPKGLLISDGCQAMTTQFPLAGYSYLYYDGGINTITCNNNDLIFNAGLSNNDANARLSDVVPSSPNYYNMYGAVCQFKKRSSSSSTGSDSCLANSSPSTIKVALLDQQDFQVQTKAVSEQVSCVSADGLTGQTGEDYAPRVNISFGNDTNPLISPDECDPKDINGLDNNDWVYCSQNEFLSELAQKIGAMVELRVQANEAESIGNFAEATRLRLSESRFSSFNANIRTQTFTLADITSSLSRINALRLLKIVGPENYSRAFPATGDIQTKLTNLFRGTTFVVIEPTTGLPIETKRLTAGSYSVTIDLNELAEITTNRYLFSNGDNLNPDLDIKVTFRKLSKPAFDWFFYEYGNNDNGFGELFSNVNDTMTFNQTNVSERGTIMGFTMNSSGSSTANSFYRTFAVPLIIRLANKDGSTRNSLSVLPDYVVSNSQVFSYWTAFASTLGGGCESIVSSGDNTMPYRIPDQKSPGTANSFALTSISSTKTNQAMFLETILYAPNSYGYGFDVLSSMNLYTKDNQCLSAGSSDVNCNLSINANKTSYKIPTNTTVKDSVNSVFEGIKNGSVCVHKGITANTTKWTLFWNEAKILKDLSVVKTQHISGVNGASLCSTVEALTGQN